MAERTQRGEADQKRDDSEMQGQPVGADQAGAAGQPGGTTTRDKGVTPVREKSGDDDAASR